jgi:uncharacterized protein YndB with AHSA1/START domain
MTARTVTIQQHYPAEPAVVWRMWTTAEGLESWWGPDGFTVEVHAVDLRPGGTMRYSMRAVDEGIAAFLRSQGMATVTTHEIRFVEVVPYRLLTYRHPVDFVPASRPTRSAPGSSSGPTPRERGCAWSSTRCTTRPGRTARSRAGTRSSTT